MIIRILSVTTSLGLALVTLAAPIAAQRASINITPYGGGVWFSEMGEVEGAFRPVGGVPSDHPVRVSNLELRAEARPMFGLSISWGARDMVDLRLNAATTATEFDMSGVSTQPGEGVTHFETLGGLADVYVTFASIDLLWRLAPHARVISPYVVTGAGAAVWDLNGLNDFETVEPLTGIGFTATPRTSIELHGALGVGVDFQFGRNASLRLEAVDNITTNPLHFSDFVTGPDFTGTTDTESLVHGLRISAGVTVGLGG